MGGRLGLAAGALVLAALLAAAGCSDDEETRGPAPTAPAPPSSDEVPLEAGLLREGDCFNGLDEEEIEVTVVPCTEEHSAEVTGRFALEGEEFPGEDEVVEQAEEGCLIIFEDYVGQAAEDTAFRFTEITPTEEQWDAGSREVVCLVLSPERGEVATSSVRDEE